MFLLAQHFSLITDFLSPVLGRHSPGMNGTTTRRKFLHSSLALAAPAILTGRLRAAEILDIKTISFQDNYYHGWPTVAKRSNGELVLAWSGRRVGHVCPFGSVESMHSVDEGETWSFPRTVHDSLIDDRDAGVLETSKGTLLVTSFTSLAYDSASYLKGKYKDDKSWWAAHNRLPDDESRKAELGCWAYRSTDGGKTFSNRIDTVVNSPHGPCRLDDGRLLYLGKELWTEDKKIGASISDDDGETWTWLAEIPTREGDRAMDYHELHAIQCADGSIVAQIRNHNTANKGETLQCRSTDKGKTWSTPREIGVWGLPSHLLRLKDDRLVMSYGHRRKPYGNQARISEDNGKTWSDPIPISEDGVTGDLGYPSTVELSDGTLLTIWYENMEGSSMARLRQARWKV